MRRTIIVAFALLAGCATTRNMPPSVASQDFLDGHNRLVIRPFRYSVGQSGQVIEVPAGFVTDYASIPSAFWGILGPHGRYGRAAVIHDYLYWSQTCTRAQADNLLMIAMRELGVRPSQRFAVYQGVHLAGGAAWRANRRERDANRPKVVPEAYYGLTADNDWRGARLTLERAGVRDPAFPTEAAYCALGNSQDVPRAPRGD